MYVLCVVSLYMWVSSTLQVVNTGQLKFETHNCFYLLTFYLFISNVAYDVMKLSRENNTSYWNFHFQKFCSNSLNNKTLPILDRPIKSPYIIRLNFIRVDALEIILPLAIICNVSLQYLLVSLLKLCTFLNAPKEKKT